MASIIELLIKNQILDERQHDAVMSRTRSTAGGHVVQQIAELGYATEGTVARAVSVELGLPRIDLAMTPPEPAAIALLDARTCADRFVLPVALRENAELLWLAMADPTDREALELVRRKTQKRVRPAVAGPTEILRAVRALYSAPDAGTARPEKVQKEKLAAIEIEGDAEADQEFEVLEVGGDIGADSSPLSRIARQLGVEVPANMPSHREAPQAPGAPAAEAPVVEVRAPKALRSIPPKTDPAARRHVAAKPFTFEELFATPAAAGEVGAAVLTDDELSTIDAVRVSLEKGALVLRALAELCVEKRLFSREEMKRRHPRS